MPRTETAGRRVVPALLGVALLAIVVAAGLTPNSGATPAASTCAYGSCPTTNSSSNPLLPWELVLVALIVLAIILAVVLLSRRRGGGGRTPPPAAPVTEWSGGGPSGGSDFPEPETAAFEAAPVAAAAGAGAGAAAAPAAYLETEEDVATPPPAISPPATPPPAAGGAGGESDIDSLMQELDKISSEILKRGTPKGEKDASEGASDEEPMDGGDGSA